MDNITKVLALELIEDIRDTISDQLDLDSNAEVEANLKMVKEYIDTSEINLINELISALEKQGDSKIFCKLEIINWLERQKNIIKEN